MNFAYKKEILRKYFIQSFHPSMYYGDLPIAKSKRRAKEIETDVKPRNLDLEIIEKLENKLSKAEIYEIFAFIYSEQRNRKHVEESEQTYIKNYIKVALIYRI